MFNRNPPPIPRVEARVEEGPNPPESTYVGPDRMQFTPRQLSETQRHEYGGSKHMGENAAGIYGTARPTAPGGGGGGDIVLRPTLLDAPTFPYIPEVSEYDIYRRQRSMLSDPGITRDEVAGSNYWDSARRTDTFKAPATKKGKKR